MREVNLVIRRSVGEFERVGLVVECEAEDLNDFGWRERSR
jgi:hypothetical protein